MHRFCFITLLFSAVILLAMNVIGLDESPTAAPTQSGSGVLVAGYHYPLRPDRTKLQAMLEAPMLEFELETVNQIVFESLIHSSDRRIRPVENWLAWLAGLVYEPAGKTQDARKIVSGGHAICSEAAAVVNAISEINGVDARLVALNGHVVSEVRTDNGWRIADPDYGGVYPHSLATLQAGEATALMGHKLHQRGYDEDTISGYVDYFETAEDNYRLDVGAASSPRLRTFEQVSEWLKWTIPVALILAGVWIGNRGLRT